VVDSSIEMKEANCGTLKIKASRKKERDRKRKQRKAKGEKA